MLDNSGPWKERAVTALSHFVRAQANGARFTGEDIRAYVSEKAGPPHHPNAWGGIINAAVRQRLILGTGLTQKPRDPRSHACRKPVYMAYPLELLNAFEGKL